MLLKVNKFINFLYPVKQKKNSINILLLGENSLWHANPFRYIDETLFPGQLICEHTSTIIIQ